MRKYRNRIVMGFAIALMIYIALVLFLDNEGKLTDEMLPHLRAFPIYLLIPLALLQVMAGLFRFLEWHYYLGVIEARDKISLLDSAVLFVSGFTLVVSPGKAGELLKAVVLKTKTGVPVARSAPVVIAERVVDGLAVVVILLVGILLAGDQIDIGPYRALIFSSAGLLGLGLVAVQIAPLAYLVLGVISRLPLIKRLHQPLVDFYESSREIFKLRHVIPTTVMGVGVYLASAVGFMLVLAGFGLEITWTLFLQAAFISGVAAAVGALSFVPNGAGVTEIADAGMLLAIVAPQNPAMTPAVAGAAAIVQGFFHKWFRVLVGLLVALIFRHRLFTPSVEQALAELEAERARKHTAYAPESSGV